MAVDFLPDRWRDPAQWFFAPSADDPIIRYSLANRESQKHLFQCDEFVFNDLPSVMF
jgi:hypothetical protein